MVRFMQIDNVLMGVISICFELSRTFSAHVRITLNTGIKKRLQTLTNTKHFYEIKRVSIH